MFYRVHMFENGRLIEVRVKARGAADATHKAEVLCPDAAHLTTERVYRSGVDSKSAAASREP